MHPITLNLQIACQKALVVPQKKDFSQWVKAALSPLQDPIEITIRLVNKEESQALNQAYRNKDQPTNILAFPFKMPIKVSIPTLLGDLVICAQIVAEEAKAQKKTIMAHWAHLVIHGTLHLLGYDHDTATAAQKMESTEIAILAKLNLPNPYEIEM